MTVTAVATALAIAARRWDARAALARCVLPDAAAALVLARGAAPLDDAANPDDASVTEPIAPAIDAGATVKPTPRKKPPVRKPVRKTKKRRR